jgi:membrane protein implicated in regulation of membrane protease activity
MRQGKFQLSGPGSGPGRPPGILSRILFSVVAVTVLAVAAILGALFLLVALGLFFIASIVMAFRVWHVRRQWQRATREGGDSTATSNRPEDRSEVIEGEYRVLGDQGERQDADRTQEGDR